MKKQKEKTLLKQRKKQNRGITLIALAVTIAVLLILAGISIATLTGKNGIINQSESAKEQTEISNEKEIVETATIQAMGKNKYGNIEKVQVEKAINSNIGEGKTEVTEDGENIIVNFIESNRYYEIDTNGNIEKIEVVKDNNPGDITIGINGEKLDGSEEKPYEIWCIEDLVAFSNMVSGEGIKLENGKSTEISIANNFNEKYIVLKKTLNFKSKLSYSNSERTDFGDINGDNSDGNILINEMQTGTGFKPIGLRTNNNGSQKFRGAFDGRENKINNIYINYENDNVDNVYKLGRTVGLFSTGDDKSTVIKNLEVSGEIKGVGHIGGIIGEYALLIENCTNNTNITGNNMVGGISGAGVTEIKNCKNNGKINIIRLAYSYGGAGGIVGNSNNIENCINNGNVYGNINNNIGGIAGTVSNKNKLKNCYNTGESKGGIIGVVKDSVSETYVNIVNSYNLGKCENGIVNYCMGSGWDNYLTLNIKNCYNLGEVSNSGIVGTQGAVLKKTTLNIENCYNAGKSRNAIIGEIRKDYSTETITNIKNTYYDETKATNIGAISEGITQMKIKDNAVLVEKLNNNISTNLEWKKWKIGENGYPTFE